MPAPRKNIDPLLTKTRAAKPIVDAILNLNQIEFYYSGPTKPSTYVAGQRKPVKRGRRVKGKPVAIGISKRDRLLVRIHVEPPSVSLRGFQEHGWRTFMLSRMSSVRVLKDKNFSLSIPKYNGGGPDGAFKRTLLFITPESVKENSKTAFEMRREEILRKKQEKEFEKIAKQRKEKARKDLREKNRKL